MNYDSDYIRLCSCVCIIDDEMRKSYVCIKEKLEDEIKRGSIFGMLSH